MARRPIRGSKLRLAHSPFGFVIVLQMRFADYSAQQSAAYFGIVGGDAESVTVMS